MKKLTFAFDCQLNDQGDWIAEGTQVEVSKNPFHLNRWKGFTPVIITKAYSYKNKPLEVNSTVEWFSNKSFVELN